MILGVIGDTHGNLALMFQAADVLAELGAEWIYHTGDDYDDARQLDHAGYKVRAVPGLWCPEYTSNRSPRCIVDRIDGVSIAMAHAQKDLHAAELSADVIITGHTHRGAIERLGASLYVNPGHLKAPVDRGERPSFATLRIEPRSVRALLCELDGTVRQEVAMERKDG